MPVRVSEEFGAEVRARLKGKGWSYRRATIATGIDHGTIGMMASGVVPKKGVVIDWATHFGEDVNKWLVLAGYDPIPEELVCDVTTADRVREDHALYLVQKKGWSEDEVRKMFEEIGEKAPGE